MVLKFSIISGRFTSAGKFLFCIFILVFTCFFTAYSNLLIGGAVFSIESAGGITSINPLKTGANPANILIIRKNTFSASYSPAVYGIKELSPANAFAAIPLGKNISLASSVNYLGNELYSELSFQSAGALYLNDDIRIGASINYSSLSIKNYDRESVWFVDIGGFYKVSETFGTGFFISNINRANFGEDTHTPLQKAVFGASFSPLEELHFDFDIIIMLERSSGAAGAIRYDLEDIASLRLAYLTNPVGMEAGAAVYVTENITIFSEVSYHQFLSFSKNFGVVISW